MLCLRSSLRSYLSSRGVFGVLSGVVSLDVCELLSGSGVDLREDSVLGADDGPLLDCVDD